MVRVPTGRSTRPIGAPTVTTTASTRSTRTTPERGSVATATPCRLSTATALTIPRSTADRSVRLCTEDRTEGYPRAVAYPPTNQPGWCAARPRSTEDRERKPPLRGLTRPRSRACLPAPADHRKRGCGRAGPPGSAAKRAARTGPRAPIAARTCSTSRQRPLAGRPGSPSVSPEPGG